MLTTSVAVVRKILEAVAGSVPNFRSVIETNAPETPLTTQLPSSQEKQQIRASMPLDVFVAPRKNTFPFPPSSRPMLRYTIRAKLLSL
jgi:hypothetical protein